MKKYSGYLSLLLAAMIYASFGIYIRILNQDLNPYQQIFFRGIVGFVLATLLIFILKKKIEIKGVSKSVIAAYMVTFPLVVILYVFSILNTKITTTLFGYYAGTLISSLFIGKIFFKEPIHIIKKISIGLTFIGLIIYTYPLSVQTFNIGLILAIVAGFFDTIANGFRKHLSGKVDRVVLVALQLLGMAVVALPFVLFTLNQGLPSISPTSWAVGIWFGLMLLVLNYLLLYAFSNFDLNLGTIVLSSELFFAAILAFLVYRETISVSEFTGAASIFSATGIVGINPDKFNAHKQNFLSKFLSIIKK